MAFTVDIRGNATHLEKTLRLAKGRIGELGDAAKMGVAGLAALGAAGAAGLTAFVVSSSKAASNIESLTMQFETLLGGADAAGKRMEEIVKFAAETPFEIAELAATSKQLQNVGGDMLAIGDGLRMVGDAAAISGKPLEEVALHIGRIFGAMVSGTSAGESTGRLVEIGLITGDVKREFEALAAAQKSGKVATLSSEQALAKLQSVLSKTQGAMTRLANTTEGKLSNMRDNLAQLQVAFGTGFNDGLKDALNAANNFLPQLQGKFSQAGKLVGLAMSEAVQGDTQRLAAIGGFIGEVLLGGFKSIFMVGVDNILAAAQNGARAFFKNPLAFSAQGPAGLTGQLRAVEEVARDPSQAADFAGYMQTAIDEAMKSESARILSQGSRMQSESAEVKKLPKTFEGMMRYLKEISDHTKMQSGARFSN
jgi:hypothetical protein